MGFEKSKKILRDEAKIWGSIILGLIIVVPIVICACGFLRNIF